MGSYKGLDQAAGPILTCCIQLLTPKPKSQRTNENLKMMDKKIVFVLAVVAALFYLSEAREEGPHDMAEALKMLQELDRYYMQAARPRIDRRDVTEVDHVDPVLLDRAVRLLKLQTLDRLYSYHTRPRFGKRAETYTNWGKDGEKPDIPTWLAYARRR